MSERRKVGSVTYREVGQDYFEQRGLRRHAGVLVALVARRRGRHLGRLLRLELRPRRRRVRRPPHRDGRDRGHVLRPLLLASPRCPRLCPTRAARIRSPARRWARGAASSPASPRTWSTSSRRRWSSARSACLMHVIMTELFDIDRRRPCGTAPSVLVAGLLRRLRGVNIVGIEATMRFTVVINILALGDPRRSSSSRSWSPASSTPSLLDEHPAGCAAESTFLPSRDRRASSRRSRSRSGSSSRSRSCRWPRRNRMDPARDIPRATIWGMTTLVITGALMLFLNTGVDGGALDIGVVSEPAVRRVQGHLRRGNVRRAVGVARAVRLDRQLLHDHLRLRPEHVLAVEGRILPGVAVRHRTASGRRRTSH